MAKRETVSMKGAAAQIGCFHGTIRRWCKELHIEPNPKTGRYEFSKAQVRELQRVIGKTRRKA